jgi:hypothetical protein
MARPSRINDRLIKEFCSLLERGATIRTAIQKTGIGYESYYRWERNVRQDRGTPLECRFIDAVNLVLGLEKLRRERALLEYMDQSWRCAAWWLERRYSDEYGKRLPLPNPDAPASRIVFQRTVSKAAPLTAAIHFEPLEGETAEVSRKRLARAGDYRNRAIPELTDQLRHYFCFLVLESGSVETARMLAGINLGRYDRMVREVNEGGGSLQERSFVKAVRCTEGEVKMVVEQKLSKHLQDNWRVSKWWLDRKYSNEYGKRIPLPPRDPDSDEQIGLPDRITWTRAPNTRS